jgi:transaldolase
MEAYLRALIEKSPGPISLEITAVTADEMIRQGHYLNNLKPDKVVVKVPVNPATDGKPNNDGMRATSELEKEGIQVNVTLIMTPEQALLAAQAGASYVSPFAGRIDDYLRTEKLKMESPEFTGKDYYPAEGRKNDHSEIVHDNGIVSGVDLVHHTVALLEKYPTQVIAASLRNARQVREVAHAGANIATIPFDVLGEMIVHPLTTKGIAKFLADVPEEYRALFK